jgi:RHS repeat-associated protein
VLSAVTKLEYDPAHPGLVGKVIPPRGNTGPAPDYTYATTFTYFASGGAKGLLESVTDAVGNKTTYAYDGVGRRTKVVDPLGNAAGGVPAEHTWETVFDSEDRVRFAKAPAPVAGGAPLVTEARFDDAGNPTVRVDPSGQVTRYIFDERNLLAEVDGTRKYVWGLGLAYAVTGAGTGTVHVLHADGLGSVRARTDDTGAVLQTYGADAFGVPTEDTGGQPFRFAGEPFDRESGLLDLRARAYDPRLGRFPSLPIWSETRRSWKLVETGAGKEHGAC